MSEEKHCMPVPSLKQLCLFSIMNHKQTSFTRKKMEALGEYSLGDFQLVRKSRETSFAVFFEQLLRNLKMYDCKRDLEYAKTLFEMKKDIVNSICAYGVVFGGHVRDYIAGEEFTTRDIDCYVSKKDANLLVLDFSSKYDVYVLGNPYNQMSTKISLQSRCKFACVVYVDIVFCDGDCIEGGYDFDVNLLTLQRKDDVDSIVPVGIRSSGFPEGTDLPIEHTIKQIVNKRLIVIPDDAFNRIDSDPGFWYDHIDNSQCVCSIKKRFRMEKMKARGWVIQNKACDNIWCILCENQDEKIEKHKRKLRQRRNFRKANYRVCCRYYDVQSQEKDIGKQKRFKTIRSLARKEKKERNSIYRERRMANRTL